MWSDNTFFHVVSFINVEPLKTCEWDFTGRPIRPDFYARPYFIYTVSSSPPLFARTWCTQFSGYIPAYQPSFMKSLKKKGTYMLFYQIWAIYVLIFTWYSIQITLFGICTSQVYIQASYLDCLEWGSWNNVILWNVICKIKYDLSPVFMLRCQLAQHDTFRGCAS